MLGGMIFALVGVLVIVAFIGVTVRRQRSQRDEAPEDQLSDEQFRRIEFGDDGP